MPLEMKTRCEKCGAAIAPDQESYICSFECTFCPECASWGQNNCPHCGGELIRRPRRKLLSMPANPGAALSLDQRPWIVWGLSFGLWIFISFFSALSMYELLRSTGRPASLAHELVVPLVEGLIFAFLTPFAFGFASRFPLQRENWVRRSGLHLAAGVIFAGAHSLLRGLVYPVWDFDIRAYAWAFWNPQSHSFTFKWKSFERLLLYNTVQDVYSVYLPIVFIAVGINYYKRFRERELRASEIEAELAKAHLQELKSQLQPHFLFNTLHSISALMHIDVLAADRMMTCLSDLLRLSLENTGVQVTTLKRELEFLNTYLAIEKIRFGDRLKIVMDIPSTMLDAAAPHLILQPLVENAIHHGIARSTAPGEVFIAANRDGKHLCLKIRDNGPGLNAPVSTGGLGLEATRKRLQTLYGSDQSIEIRNMPERGAEVRIRIPFSVPARLS